MKSFARTIVVFMVLNLATAGMAARNVVEADTDEARAARTEIDAAKERMPAASQATSDDEQKVLLELMEKEVRSGALPAYPENPWWHSPVAPPVAGSGYAGGILVIPAEQIKTKHLVTIMEDLTVMSRILDKKLGRWQDNPLFGNLSVFSDARGGTQCIYLEGYGALFIIKVDFPLAPSIDMQEKDETEEPADRLWEQTRQEILTPPDTARRRRIRVQTDTEQRYDAEKVEELKRNLIKSLRHAANIRALEPEHWLIITVIGSGETNIVGILTDSKKGTVEVITKDGKIVRTTYEGGLPDNLGSCSPTVMTIRVKKSDVDAFAAGEMDLDAFTQKVQIYTY
ncbi:MAG TPA: hypothetical protein VMX13_07880 [Sedimentisphaerales bacterium]|nr:hypothetical protein [Sedimentisphaerales bacterium]